MHLWQKGSSAGGVSILWKMGISSGWGEGTSEGLWAGGALGEVQGPRPGTWRLWC